jgi:hypothetical protein
MMENSYSPKNASSSPRTTFSSNLSPFEAQQSMQTSIPVSSRLFYPTVSYVSAQLKREEEKIRVAIDEEEESRLKNIAPVDPNASFLQPTKSWSAAFEESIPEFVPIEETEARKSSLRTGPQVESRLYESTTAHERHRWRPKEEIELEKQIRLEEELKSKLTIGVNKKVTKVSEHILTPTKAMEAAMWRKDDPGPDPRELGWRVAGTAKKESFPLSPSSAGGSDMDSVLTSDTKSSKKVKEPSSRILTPTVGNQFARWHPPEDDQPKPIHIPKKTPKLSYHLLAPTAKMHLSTYVKPVVEVDPREKGWNDKFHLEKSPRSPQSTTSPSYSSNGYDYAQMSDTSSLTSYDTMNTMNNGRTRRVSEVSESLVRPTVGNLHARWVPPNTTPAKKSSSKLSKSKSSSSNESVASSTRSRSMSLAEKSPSIKEAISKTQNRAHWEEYKKSIDISSADQDSIAAASTGQSEKKIKKKKKSREQLGSTSTRDEESGETNGALDLDHIVDKRQSTGSVFSDSPDVEDYDSKSRSFRWASVPVGVSILEAAKQLELEEETSSQGSWTHAGEVSASLLKPTAATENAKWNKPIANSPLKLSRMGSEMSTMTDERGMTASSERSLRDLDIFHKKKPVNPLSTPRKYKNGSASASRSDSPTNITERSSIDQETTSVE